MDAQVGRVECAEMQQDLAVLGLGTNLDLS